MATVFTVFSTSDTFSGIESVDSDGKLRSKIAAKEEKKKKKKRKKSLNKEENVEEDVVVRVLKKPMAPKRLVTEI